MNQNQLRGHEWEEDYKILKGKLLKLRAKKVGKRKSRIQQFLLDNNKIKKKQ